MSFEADPATPVFPKILPLVGPEAGFDVVGALELPNKPPPAGFAAPNREVPAPLVGVDAGLFNELPPGALSNDELFGLTPKIPPPVAGDVFEPPPKRPAELPNSPLALEDDAAFEGLPNKLPTLLLLELPEPKLPPPLPPEFADVLKDDMTS